MSRFVRVAIVFVAVMSLTASGVAQECIPTEAKDTETHIEFAPSGGVSLTTAYFEQNGCDWGGLEQLNGWDGSVVDVEGQAGTGSVIGDVGLGTVVLVLKAYFLDADCNKVDGSDFQVPTDNNPYSMTIPDSAKWLVFYTSTQVPSRDIAVFIHSDGRDCEVVEEPPPPEKKKKKKKK